MGGSKANLAVIAVSAIALSACGSSRDSQTLDQSAAGAGGAGAGAGTGVSSSPVQAGPVPGTVEEFEVTVGDRVFFDYDQATLRPDAQTTLQLQAEWLKRNPSANILVEGHADERGTREYNLALGERRAIAVRNFLVGLGISANRIQTVSYGKERPIETCSQANCWSKNRRAVTMVSGVPAS